MRSYSHGGTHLRRVASLALVLPAVALSIALGAPGALAATPSGPSVPPKDGPAGPETPSKIDPVIDAKVTLTAPDKFVPGTAEKITMTPTVDVAAPLQAVLVVQNAKIADVKAPGWEARKVTDAQYLFTVDAEHSLAVQPVTATVKPFDGPERTGYVAGKVDLLKGADVDPTNNSASKKVAVQGAGTISGFVWQDLDKDGVQDGTRAERGLAGSVVGLLQPVPGDRPRVVTAVEVGADGTYSFEHQPLGAYQIIVVAPDRGWTFTKPNVGSDEAKDSDVTFLPVQAASAKVRLGARQLRRIAKIDEDAPLPDAAISEVITLDGKCERVIDAGLVKVVPASPSPSESAPVPTPTPTAGGDGTLPTTGASLPVALGSGAALLVGGALLTVLARRRRRSAA